MREPAAPPRAFESHTREQVRAKLLKALAEPMTSEDWESIRRECRERLNADDSPLANGGSDP